jgi:hypothetical protein
MPYRPPLPRSAGRNLALVLGQHRIAGLEVLAAIIDGEVRYAVM